MTGRMLASAAVMICLLAPGSARAQFNQYWLPVEQGLLDSHVDVQLQYSRLALWQEDVNIAVLAIEAQYAIKKRFEVGLGIPAMVHNYGTGVGYEDGTAFGNMMVNFKVRLFSIGEVFSLAAYSNVMLPTHSGADSREYAMFLPGVAASGKLLGVQVGGGLGLIWLVNGLEEVGNQAYVTLDAYGGYSLFGILTFKLALQYANSFHPDSEVWALGIVPGVEVDILDIVRVGAATRIATNDEAKLLYGGRASLLVHGGISF